MSGRHGQVHRADAGASGKVAAESLQVAGDRMGARFALTSHRGNLIVTCSGPLPDNPAEGMDVVVEEQLEASGVLRGDRVLTRCASKYEAGTPSAPSSGKPG